jgi:hypothetical protein
MIEKEYYQYLNQIWSECLTAAANDKEQAGEFFDKAASPYHYWKESQLLKPGEQPREELLTDKQRGAIDNFLNSHEELCDELETKYGHTGKPEELTKAKARVILDDWIHRFIKK